ncbi:MAG: hypothetical protein AB4426_19380 [Xenococcaceae cyanobacterium]
MAGYGAIHTARSDINNIRNMLFQGQNQQTSLIFILKEIVQNADDCCSKRLSIGWSNGLNKAKHPLLQGSAILVVNDGYFSKKDARSIRSIGASAKENDSSAVGKFGIGLKTVFLICEAFFFLKGPKADPEVDSGSMLNLWATDDPDDVPTSNWDELKFEKSDQTLIAEERKKMGFEDGFTLWLPLRKPEHCQRGEDLNPIVAQYFGDGSQFIHDFSDSLLGELAGFFPLLKNLKTIELYDGKTIDRIQVGSESNQCFPDFKTLRPNPHSLKGDIRVKTKQQKYFGYQQILDNVELNALKDRENWPTLIPDAKGCRKKQKAEQHCAAVILSRPKTEGQGKLLIRWAVFLPTAEPPTGGNFEKIPLESDEDYVLTLHGFFFLRADRRRILDWSEFQNNGVLQQWNKILAEQGTLPLILPTLADFAKAKSPEVMKELTQRFKKTELWENYQKFICYNGSWAYVVRFDDGCENSQWDFIEGEVTIYSIPESNHLIEVLPGLKHFSQNHILTYKNWPVLSLQKTTSLPSSEIVNLLYESYSSAPRICADSEQVNTLVNFLKDPFPFRKPDAEVIQALQGFLQQALSSTEFHPAQNICDLLKIIPSEQVLYVPEACPSDLLLALLELQKTTTCVIAASSLKSKNDHDLTTTTLSANDARILLETLSQFAQEKNLSFVESFALKVIEWTPQRDGRLLQHIKNLSLFRLKVVGQENKIYISSLAELQQYLDKKRLFSQNNQPFVDILSQAIEQAIERDIYMAKSSIGQYLTIKENLPTCDSDKAIALLSQKPPLKPVSQRKKLLEKLQQHLDDRLRTKQAIRYLLHGESKQFSREDTLYAGDSSISDLWYRVLRHLIGKKQEWRFISSELLDLLSPRVRAGLSIADVDKSSIEEELKHKHLLSSIDWSGFSVEDREMLIQKLEEGLAKKLRIHETLNSPSQLVAIDEHTYLEGGFEINPNLVKELGIVLIRRSQRDDVAYRQKKLSPPLTAEDALERILELDNPGQHWETIMEALASNPSECSQVDGLKTTEWLPLKNDRYCKPEDVIYIPKLKEDLVRLSAECDGAFIASDDLLPEVQNHSAFKVLHKNHLFPSTKDALEMLGAMLLDNSDYCVGNIQLGETRQSITLQNWLKAFELVPEAVMPAVRLLKPLAESDSQVQTLYKALQGELNTERLVTILNELSGRHEKKKDKNVYSVYCEYLEIAVDQEEWFDVILPEIKLLSEAGEWQSSKELCYDAPNIAPLYLLCQDLAEIIEYAIEIADAIQEKDSTVSNIKTHDFLGEYFSAWPNSTKNGISAFLSCLGNTDEIRELASSFLPNAESFPNLVIIEQDDREQTLTDLLIESNIELNFRESQETMVQVKNLLGDSLSVKLKSAEQSQSLLIGSPDVSCTPIQINLRPIDTSSTSQFSHQKLNELLKNTTLEILDYVYQVQPNNFDSAWEKWQKSSPPDIRLTQNLLLDEAMVYLRQNQFSEDSEIAQLVRKRINLRTRQAERELLEEAGTPVSKSSQNLERDLQDIKQELRQLLETDFETRKILLEGVRRRIQDANYDIASVPFEIFQNADDACYELHEMECPHVQRQMKIIIQKRTLYFLHWGRGINQARWGSTDYRAQGYDQDLTKMLLLNFSDKKEGVTGKFGLGFKSVYLLTDQPRVVSDRLGFEVCGGLYPKQLNQKDFQELTKYRESEEGTVIKLPLLSAAKDEISQQIQRFESYTPLLGAFSHWLKEFVIEIENHESRCEWREQEITSEVTVGELIPRSETFHRALLLGANGERFVFPLGLRGIEALPDIYPTFWVTAPTRMDLKVGFAVNAMFRLDVGRSQLDLRGGGQSENQEIAKRLGHQLGKALIKLYNLNEEQLRRHLHLAADTTPLIFWTSVWDVLGVQFAQKHLEEEGIKLLHQMLWGENCGMTQLYQKCDALPTGLPNTVEAFNGLTRPEQVCWYVTGVLDNKNDSVLQTVLRWPCCQRQNIKPGQLISSSVAQTLKKLTGKQIEPLKLLTLLQWELEDELTPECTARIGELIQQKFVETLKEEERSQIIKVLTQVKFQAKDGNRYVASELLVAENNSDESLIVKFAPSSAILEESYQSKALRLFDVCRQDEIIPVSTLVQWIGQAEGEKRDDALRYLLEGKRRDDIILYLKSQIPNWIAEIKHQTQQEQLMDRGFKKYRLLDLLDRLDLLNDRDFQPTEKFDQEAFPQQEEDNILLPSPQKTPEQWLRQILDWWQKERNHLIEKYENSIYPASNWKLTSTNYNLQKPSTTKAWLALLLLGTCHSMGRTKPEQHREFLKHCERWNWFTAMSTRKLKASDWFKLLEDYFASIETGERLEYYQWVRHYPAVYAFARWWEIYRDSLLFTNKDGSKWGIDIVFSPRNNNRFLQGSGKGNDAPPIGKILGMGQPFVVRELLRAGILTSPAMHCYAYVPVRRVRGILQAIGCQGIREGGENRNIANSNQIYNFLVKHLGKEDATFCGDYDLPFLMLDQEPDRRKKEILGDIPSISEEPSEDDVVGCWASEKKSSEDGDFVTLWDGRVIPRSYMD